MLLHLPLLGKYREALSSVLYKISVVIWVLWKIEGRYFDVLCRFGKSSTRSVRQGLFILFLFTFQNRTHVFTTHVIIMVVVSVKVMENTLVIAWLPLVVRIVKVRLLLYYLGVNPSLFN